MMPTTPTHPIEPIAPDPPVAFSPRIWDAFEILCNRSTVHQSIFAPTPHCHKPKSTNPYSTSKSCCRNPRTTPALPSIPESSLTDLLPPLQPTLFQQSLYLDPANEPWGDSITKDIPTHIIRILSHNVNTINPAQDFLEWKAVAYTLHNYSVGIACLQETNTQWTPPLINRVWQVFQQLPKQMAKLATSSSKDVILGNYQPGGTCTVSLGCWTTRARLADQDYHGLGCWSYIKFEGRDAHRNIFASGYRSCNQPTRLGSRTYHDQQYCLLLAASHTRPNPRLQFLDDIIQQIQTWRHQKKAVLLCMDTNDNVTRVDPKKGLGRLFAETDLVDLHHYHHPHSVQPPTYTWGQLTLDICLGSPEFVLAITKAAILPFGIPIHLAGDHHALILDFDSRILFGNALPNPKTTSPQGIYSNNILTVTKFSKLVGEGCKAYRIQERIAEISTKTHLDHHDHNRLDQIDNDLTQILVTVNT